MISVEKLKSAITEELTSYTDKKSWSKINVDIIDREFQVINVNVKGIKINNYSIDAQMRLINDRNNNLSESDIETYLKKMLYYVLNTPYGLYYSSQQREFYDWLSKKKLKFTVHISGTTSTKILSKLNETGNFRVTEYVVSLSNKNTGTEYWRVYTVNYGLGNSKTSASVVLSGSFGRYIKGYDTIMHEVMLDHVLKLATKLKMFSSFDEMLKLVIIDPTKVYSICPTTDKMIIKLLMDKLTKYGTGGLIRFITKIIYDNIVTNNKYLKVGKNPRFAVLSDGQVVFSDMSGYISGLMTCKPGNALPVTVTAPGTDLLVNIFIANYRRNWDEVLM